MHVFSTYIQPLTYWLYDHPQWALWITFLISLSESLAIIGSIIPGSVTMTAIGILAGSGVMRIDLTLIAATLGAIVGDGASYALGYLFSDRLTNLWPFRRYPKWLNYGKDYFARYGATSVLIGRFVGPMRSIIPVIAGMMRMSHWRFFLANAVSAMGWAILYIVPGILIGQASSELSTESATRLFLLILVLLGILWLLSFGTKWLLVNANQYLSVKLDKLWHRLARHPRIGRYINRLTPKDETNHYPTAGLIILLILSVGLSYLFITLSHDTWASPLNNTVYLFLQSLRTQSFDAFFVVIRLMISPLSLGALIIATTLSALYYRNWRILGYWLSLSLVASLSVFLLTHSMSKSTLPDGQPIPLHLDIHLTFATALFGFLMFYFSAHYKTILALVLRIVILLLLCLAGIAAIYLGDAWTTNVLAAYFVGLSLCLLHKIAYRRYTPASSQSQRPIVFICTMVLLASGLSYKLYFKTLLKTHCPHPKQYVITDHVWWNQERPLLPMYSTNRIGQFSELLNIQYLGSLQTLENSLHLYGWKRQSRSFLHTLLLRAGGKTMLDTAPFMPPLYLNKKPALTMTYGHRQDRLILRLWRSNYHLRHHRQPIWLGSLHHANHVGVNNKNIADEDPVDMYRHIINALPNFKTNQIIIPNENLQLLPPYNPAMLLVIREETSLMSKNSHSPSTSS